MDTERSFFLNPIHVTHKKYEVLRSLYVDRLKAKDAADMFSYSIHTINVMKREFTKALNNHQIDASHFFVTHKPGRHIDTDKATTREKIIKLRKENYSILDIKSVLHTEGYKVSHDYIYLC